jgi:hypothetical protein
MDEWLDCDSIYLSLGMLLLLLLMMMMMMMMMMFVGLDSSAAICNKLLIRS